MLPACSLAERALIPYPKHRHKIDAKGESIMHTVTTTEVFLLAMLTYFTLALGLIALGAHVSRVQERLLTALELLRESTPSR